MLQDHLLKVNPIFFLAGCFRVYGRRRPSLLYRKDESTNAQIILPLLGAKKRSLLCSLIY